MVFDTSWIAVLVGAAIGLFILFELYMQGKEEWMLKFGNDQQLEQVLKNRERRKKERAKNKSSEK